MNNARCTKGGLNRVLYCLHDLYIYLYVYTVYCLYRPLLVVCTGCLPEYAKIKCIKS